MGISSHELPKGKWGLPLLSLPTILHVSRPSLACTHSDISFLPPPHLASATMTSCWSGHTPGMGDLWALV